MQLPRLFRTSVFRLTLAYMALFALSVGALSAFIYWATLGYLDTQTNAIIEAEINGLYEQYERSSLRGLGDVIEERVQRDTERRSFYLLADAIGRPLAGNVPNWPAGVDDARGQWVDFVQSDSDTPVRAMLLRVGPGLPLARRPRHPRAHRDQASAAPRVVLRHHADARAGAHRRRAARRQRGAAARRDQPHDAADHGGRPEPARAAERQRRRARRARAEHQRDARPDRAPARRHAPRRRQRRARSARADHAAAQSPRDRRGRRAIRTATISPTASRSSTKCSRRSTRCCASRASSPAPIAARSRPSILQPIVRDVCELYQAAAEERHVTLHGEAAEPVEVYGDRELLAQVLTNLVDNAVKYTPAGGVVRIELARSGDTARLRVADSGPGIPAEDRSRVLQRFTRLDRARSQPGNGLGLGARQRRDAATPRPARRSTTTRRGCRHGRAAGARAAACTARALERRATLKRPMRSSRVLRLRRDQARLDGSASERVGRGATRRLHSLPCECTPKNWVAGPRAEHRTAASMCGLGIERALSRFPGRASADANAAGVGESVVGV